MTNKRERKAKKKRLAIVIGGLVLLIIIVAASTSSSSGSYHYTCPASKYVLSNGDFNSGNWQATSLNSSGVSFINLRNNDGYQCSALGKVVHTGDTTAMYTYKIYIFDNVTYAKNAFIYIKNAYLKNSSVTSCSLGSNCFYTGATEMTGVSGVYWVWIQDGNAIVGIRGVDVGVLASIDDVKSFGNTLLSHMHKISENS